MQSIRHLMYLSRPIGRYSLWKPMVGRRCMCVNDSGEKSVEKLGMSFVENSTSFDKVDREFQIDWNKEISLIEVDEYENNRSILAPVEDESQVYAEPMLRPSFNLAAYAQKSDTLQQLIKLGVNLEQLDKQNAGEFIANLDFKNRIEPYITYLTKDIGVSIDQIGNHLSKNSDILKESLDDIQIRNNYLQLKRFTQEQIVTIVTKNPKWLNWSTREIDERLGFFQKEFELTGDEVRSVTVTEPRLITYDLGNIKTMSFSIIEECCFEANEVKQILLKCPKIWMMHQFDFMQRYDYVSDYMKISNAQLVKTPHILTNRLFRIKERHGFLKKIGKAQYNPKKELYISLDALIKGNDEEFVLNIAKCTYKEYDRYLRTL